MVRSVAFSIALLVVVLIGAACAEAGSQTSSLASSTSASSTTATTSSVPTTPAPTTTVPSSTTTSTIPLELGDELVFNGDFESGDDVPAGWEVITEAAGQAATYVADNGTHHLRFSAPLVEDVPWPEARLVGDFPVSPHTDYRLSAEARTMSQGRLFLALVFLDEDGDEILLRGPGSPEIEDTEWTEVGGILESPVDAASARVVMRLAVRPDLSDANSFTVEVNRVSVREVLD